MPFLHLAVVSLADHARALSVSRATGLIIRIRIERVSVSAAFSLSSHAATLSTAAAWASPAGLSNGQLPGCTNSAASEHASTDATTFTKLS